MGIFGLFLKTLIYYYLTHTPRGSLSFHFCLQSLLPYLIAGPLHLQLAAKKYSSHIPLMANNSRIASCLTLQHPISRPLPQIPKVPMAVKKSISRCEKVFSGDLMSFAAKGSLGSLRGGSAVLERPTFDQSQFDRLPDAEEGGDIGRLSNRKGLGNGDSYKVLLVDDARHTEKLVENALPQVVPSITADDARKLFHESRQKGVAIVIVAVKEHAEFYAQMMLRKGLRSAIEPDAN